LGDIACGKAAGDAGTLAGLENCGGRLQHTGMPRLSGNSQGTSQVQGADPQHIESHGGDLVNPLDTFWIFNECQGENGVVDCREILGS
jgi:hypothetical protein